MIKKVKILILPLLLMMTFCTSPNLVDSPPAFLEFMKAPLKNEVLDVDHVFFKWKGSNSDYKFKYYLFYLDELNYSTLYSQNNVWSTQQEINFAKLDEGSYVMRVVGNSFEITDSIELPFSVDAIKGAALSFHKNETTINVGDTASVQVWVENVDSLVAFHIASLFNPNIVNLVRVSNGEMGPSRNFSQIILPPQLVDTSFTKFNDKAHIGLINQIGKIEITSVFVPNTTFNSTKSI